MSKLLVVDASVLGTPLSGVGVYVGEVLARLSDEWRILRRGGGGGSAKSRAWLRAVPGAYAARRVRMGFPPPPKGAVFWGTNFLLPPLFGAPAVVTVHDLIFAERPEWADKWRGRAFRSALPSTLRRARAVVVSTESCKSALLARYGEGVGRKTHVIAPGIRALNAEPSAGRPFVVVGNIEPRKDPFTALYAHRLLPGELRREHPLLFIGAPADARYHQRLLAALDPPYSRALGRLDDRSVAALYASCAACIAPSLAEGFGFVPLEAFVAGAPVIAADLAVTRETIGSRARFFPPSDAARLAELMTHVSHARPSATERQALLGRFQWDDTAARYAKLFAEVSRPFGLS